MQGIQLSLDMAPPAPPTAPPPPPPPYTVRLRDSDLGPSERIEAETRFSKVMEDKLGTPEVVRETLRTLQDAEYLGRTLTDDEQALARKWKRAHLVAREAGLQSLAAISAAWFEVSA
ncbi:hypothetical protein [Pseudorhodoferax sp. Leaf267]|uniref:hypothetical protein n=1 Tax=Pseudorhodoferax sp. Leaf267 TaxID=1736316 RepID=UPI0012E20AA2|nr:hypothetical protein [Pseudorhodoferax sp. Leaf267]